MRLPRPPPTRSPAPAATMLLRATSPASAMAIAQSADDGQHRDRRLLTRKSPKAMPSLVTREMSSLGVRR